MTAERYQELCEAGPVLTAADVALLREVPKLRPMVIAVAQALGGTIRFYRRI